ncbi:TraB/GumN family protein [Stakelama tenebrarum]|uniref:TraB/GumN family protein n=1 Tax=Stakelama tenebrarum TaxID=2711215 RepID=A0A6G6Y1Y3_9SPHN|nr:TraB/GumN family protein [Sphingosinithalassobacter tenebrarum]QIG78954.1 TraB/GumN family protein [Sphingosinithalassobacter tenebrarum]
MVLKTMFRASAALALAMLPVQGFAQEAEPVAATAPAAAPTATQDADPALWVLRDADTTIYLFGTVHFLKPGLSWFDEAVREAFDRSDELVLEMVQPDKSEMTAKVVEYAVATSGPSLREKLSDDYRETLETVLDDLGQPKQSFDRVEPWFATMTLAVLPLVIKYGYDPESGAEYVLTETATREGKTISGLETVDQQLGFFDSIPEALQIAYLEALLDNYADLGTSLEKVVRQWAAGNSGNLGALMNENMRETPGIASWLLVKRNQNWANWIDDRMDRPGTVFVAVGAGHLAGDDSVQNFLSREHGLTATRVEY